MLSQTAQFSRGSIALCLMLAASVAADAAAQGPTSVLPPWSEGTLDIHHINTGTGSSALLVLPDGTSLLVDAGWAGQPGPPRFLPVRPDASRNPGEWIARYAQRVLWFQKEPAIDYAVLTHFHGDHIGRVCPQARKSAGGYLLTGITEVAEHIPIRTILDRGWPDYSYPKPLQEPDVQNYRAFLKFQTDRTGLLVERFQPGRTDQIVLRLSPSKYPNFGIRNVVANGEVSNGRGSGTRRLFPPLDGVAATDYPNENHCSIGFKLHYGRFDYASFGDLAGIVAARAPAWHDVETPVAKVVGPVDALVLNHHGMRDASNASFIATLRPRVLIVPVWASNHADPVVLERIMDARLFPGRRDIFATNAPDPSRRRESLLRNPQGHILIRVYRGGEAYEVLILDDSAETFAITARYGPYRSR